MTTTFLVAEAELSRQLADFWSSTTTGAGAATTLVDTTLMTKTNDWITDETWAFLIKEPASAAAIYDERKVSSLDNSNGTLTCLTFAAAPGTDINYELHRLFSPSEKRRALIYAARGAFPYIHEKIWDESLVSGNWLKDGSFEIWTSTSALTHWTKSASTLLQTSTAYYFKHGAYSCKINTAAGYIQQSVSNWDDLKKLAGKSVTFTVQGWCDTASCLRISIKDGVNDEVYSDYHAGDSAWTEDDDPMEVTANIDDNPTEITFKIYHALEAASETSYVDDARVICSGTSPRLFIDHLGLAQEKPIRIYIESEDYSDEEPWILIHNAEVDTESGYLYLPSSVPSDYRLRIIGMGYLDFLASGVSSTAWTATININSPQTDILIAQAILYLYTWMSMPNFESGTREDYQQMMAFWDGELRKRIAKYHMPIPSAPVKWR